MRQAITAPFRVRSHVQQTLVLSWRDRPKSSDAASNREQKHRLVKPPNARPGKSDSAAAADAEAKEMSEISARLHSDDIRELQKGLASEPVRNSNSNSGTMEDAYRRMPSTDSELELQAASPGSELRLSEP